MTSTSIPPAGIPAIVYGRISQDPDFTLSGVERHTRLCLRRVQETSNWTLVQIPGSRRDPKDESAGYWPDGVLIDNNISAATGKLRTEYQRLMAAVDAGDVKVIVAYSQSRLWRNRKERADGFERLAKAKVRLEFVKGASYDFKDATSRMVAGIIGETETWFAEITSENQRATAADQAERGAYHGKRPFGYDRVPAPGEKRGAERSLTINEKEARYLREAYRRADPEGEAQSLHAIGKWLDSEGVLTPTGMSWLEAGTSSLSLILISARNIGQREHSEGWDGHGHRPPGKLYPGNWRPVIEDEALFWRVREYLTAPGRRRPGPKTTGKHLLTGMVYCGGCGHPMYVCHNRSRPRWTCQRCWTVRAKAAVDAKVLRIVFAWMSENGPFDRAVAKTEPADLAALRITLDGHRRKRRDILDDFYDDKITRDDRDYQVTRKDAQIAEAEARLRDYDREMVLTGVEARGDAFASQWARWSGEGKAGMASQRKFLASMIKRVVVYPAAGSNKPSGRLIVVEAGSWAARLPDPGEVTAPTVPDPFTLTARGKAVAALSARPGAWLSRDEIAAAMGRQDEAPAILNLLLKRMIGDGVAERRRCRYGTAVENGTKTLDQARAERGSKKLRGLGCYGYRLAEGGQRERDTGTGLDRAVA